uniref:Protein NO VEIN C-terminal domain-containing protein n=1 Tax=uncultured marine group II/III euryarchaeote KM3_205_F07 TaxID=1456425 RepID=A0A075GV56_9EURY|nr:hypothetical protein [uncultured marine group II/III euryarchaeote KM3_205_F07]
MISLSLLETNSADITSLYQLLAFFQTENTHSIESINQYIQFVNGTQNSVHLAHDLHFFCVTDDSVTITERGREFSNLSTIHQRRQVLFEIAKQDHVFLSVLVNARLSRIGDIRRNYQQLLRDAGLLPPLDSGAKKWWIILRCYLREVREPDQDLTRLALIGLRGEELSLEYEKRRLQEREGIEHTSVDVGDGEGYDILSFVDEGSRDRLRIEVKASVQDIDTASIYLTWNEWEKALMFGPHEFHLWPNVESPTQEPIIVTVEQMLEHVPEERGAGRWDKVSIPMISVFE